MGEFVLLYLVAFTLSVFLVPIIRRLALRVGAIDQPDRVRKIHAHAVPRMGGVAIFIAFIVPVVGAYILGAVMEGSGRTFRVYEVFQKEAYATWALLGSSFLILLLGVYDDIYRCPARVKVVVEVVAAGILCAAGIYIGKMANPFTGQEILLGWWGIPLTVLWVLAITNAVNLIDGMDGLGPGVGLFVAVTMFLVSIFFDVPLVTAVTAALVGAVIGFLIFNFYPAKIFMGDAGSLFVGFLLAAVSMQASVKKATMFALLIPIVALALPIVDTMLAIARRWARGLPISAPDRQHVHHKLVSMGLSQREAVFVLYGVSVVMGCVALLIAMFWRGEQINIAIAIAAGAILAIIVGVHLLGGREFSAVGSRVVKAFRRRRRLRESWVQVYATTAKMENAESLEQLWGDVSGLFEALDVDSVKLVLSLEGGPPRPFIWTRPAAGPDAPASNGSIEGWIARLPLASNGKVRGELEIVKDTRRSPLQDGVPEMIEIIRKNLLVAVERLSTPAGGSAVPSASGDPSKPVSAQACPPDGRQAPRTAG
jgi:UDP-GlcNAc:undecaprenyl-phosphate GlcNAc-1-phosphate transferase